MNTDKDKLEQALELKCQDPNQSYEKIAARVKLQTRLVAQYLKQHQNEWRN